jgi:hypothetical protein
MIQLKVRVKAIVQNIVKAGLPPPHVTKFLGVLIEDGHYFKKEFFFESEKRLLDFNRFVYHPYDYSKYMPLLCLYTILIITVLYVVLIFTAWERPEQCFNQLLKDPTSMLLKI